MLSAASLVDVPPVAVVVPCFNDGATLCDAVGSALAQQPSELVVVNDGSSDAMTLTVLDALRAEGVSVIDQPNSGVASARMAGVQATQSALILFLDGDDMLAPGALEVMARALHTDPELAVVWGDVQRFGHRGYRRYPKGRTLDPWRITHVNELVASTMVRRTKLLDAGGWSLNAPFEDWDLWMAMAERGMKGRHVGVTTLLYRVEEPRRYRRAVRSYGELSSLLETRHEHLYRNRRRFRQIASAGLALKFAWTVIDRLPLPPPARRYAYFGALVLCEPSRRWRSKA